MADRLTGGDESEEDGVVPTESSGTAAPVADYAGHMANQAADVSGYGTAIQAGRDVNIHEIGRGPSPVGGRRSKKAAASMDEAAVQLANAVRRQWSLEIEKRRLHDPLPLPVRFEAASRRLLDHWSNIVGAPIGSTAPPLPLAGRLDQFIDIYRSVPSGRMIVLGKAGAGKSVLALRFVLDVLQAWTSDLRVPVILNIGSWNPVTTDLRDWMEARLIRDYAGLEASVGADGTIASALIADNRILPVLDGFDEIAAQHRKYALRTLNDNASPMVLTSRTQEYEAVVRDVTVLSRAAAVQLRDLSLADLSHYLPRTSRRFSSRDDRSVWVPVLEEVRQHPGSPLAEVLSNPLMVGLARNVYSEGQEHHPATLVDDPRYRTADAIADHLLDSFIPALYERPPDPRRTSRVKQVRWSPEQVLRWSRYLAHRMDRDDTRDLLWWNLTAATPRRTTAAVFGLLGAGAGYLLSVVGGQFAVRLIFGLVLAVGFGVWILLRLSGGMPTSLVFGLAGGMAFGTPGAISAGIFGWGIGALVDRRQGARRPVVARIGVRRNLRRAAGGLASIVVAGLLTGIGAGVLGGVAGGFAPGLLSGLAIGVATALAGLISQPVDTAHAVSPYSALQSDRSSVLLLGSMGGLLFGLAYAMADNASLGPILLTGCGFALFGVLALGLGSAWGEFETARIWLAIHGNLPWRTFTFLQDAYTRGLLRQNGPAYQFRHARLQDRLTENLQSNY